MDLTNCFHLEKENLKQPTHNRSLTQVDTHVFYNSYVSHQRFYFKKEIQTQSFVLLVEIKGEIDHLQRVGCLPIVFDYIA